MQVGMLPLSKLAAADPSVNLLSVCDPIFLESVRQL